MGSVRRPKPIIVDRVRGYADPSKGVAEGGRWYWRITIHRDGKRECLTSGRWTRPEAVKQAQAALAALDRPREAAAAAPYDVLTVGDLMWAWFKHEKARAARGKIKPKTLEGRFYATQRVDGYIGLEPVGALSEELLDDLSERAKEDGFAPQTIRFQWFAAVRKAWRHGYAKGYINRPPKIPTIEKTPVRSKHRPTAGDAYAVIDAMREGYAHPDHPGRARREPAWVPEGLTILLASGMRVGELARLLWSDIDRDAPRPFDLAPGHAWHGVIRLREGKTGPRVIPLTPAAAAALDRLPADGPRLFGRVPGSVESGIRRALTRFPWEQAGIERFTSKGLRAAAVDTVYRLAGNDPKRAAFILGHSVTTALEWYRKVTLGEASGLIIAAGLGDRPESSASVTPINAARRGQR